MKVRDLIRESETQIQSQPTDKRVKLRLKLKEIWSVIEKFEKNGEIHKDDQPKIDTFKDFISDMVKNDGRV